MTDPTPGEPTAREIELADGTRLEVRPLRPTDGADLVAGFDRLSPQSRYLRFFTPLDRLSDDLLDRLTDVDDHDRVAWVAFDLGPPDRPGVGVARYVRLADDPEAAEAAVTVIDDYQGRGIGSLLLRFLIRSAREHGVHRFVSYVQVDNAAMQHIFAQAGAELVRDEPGVLRAVVDVDEVAGTHSAPLAILRRLATDPGLGARRPAPSPGESGAPEGP